MDNLLSSTDVGTIFPDRQLRIRRFTPQIAETFNLVAHDIGRPIEAFAHTLDHRDLVDDLNRVLQTAQPGGARAVKPAHAEQLLELVRKNLRRDGALSAERRAAD